MNCLACKNKIGRGELLACTSCSGLYHYTCLNITTAFYRERQVDLRRLYKCPSCENKTRRRDDDTPIKNKLTEMLEETDMSYLSDDNNEPPNINVLEETVEIPTPPKSDEQNMISFDKFSQLLQKELHNLKTTITTEITQTVKDIITREIKTSIINMKTEIQTTTKHLTTQQVNIEKKIEDLNRKVQQLESENRALRSEIDEISKAGNTQNTPSYKNNERDTLSPRKIVLYGLCEYNDETERDLIERISDIFYNTIGVDANPYIENIARIGRRGNRRPLVIEFISQRFVRYILGTKYLFRNTEIALSEYKKAEDLKMERQLRQTVREARQEGKNVYIRGKKLFLNGQEYIHRKLDSETPENITLQEENTTKENPKENSENGNQQSKDNSPKTFR